MQVQVICQGVNPQLGGTSDNNVEKTNLGGISVKQPKIVRKKGSQNPPPLPPLVNQNLERNTPHPPVLGFCTCPTINYMELGLSRL